MKHLIYLGSVVVLIAFASCKKQSFIQNNNAVLPVITDSASYVVDGALHTGNMSGVFTSGNQQTNITLDPVDKITQHGDKDSVQYYRTYTIYGNGSTICISVIKKYNKLQLPQPNTGNILAPANPLDLFALGQHPYAVDFNRENAQNGVAIQASNTGGTTTTYSPFPLNVKTTILSTAQVNSKFQVISLTKQANGWYIMEAKFSATIFDSNENPHKLENGYIRLHVY